MSIDEQIELLKYKIKILSTIVASDKHPFFMFLLDYDFTERQTQTLNDVLYIMNHRLKINLNSTDDQSNIYFSHKIEEFIKRNKLLITTYPNLLSESIPNSREFVEIIEEIHSKSINPMYLLTAIKNQGIYVELCDTLLNELQS